MNSPPNRTHPAASGMGPSAGIPHVGKGRCLYADYLGFTK
jgi:hypothetical protein